MYGISQTPIAVHYAVQAINDLGDGQCTVTLGPAAARLCREDGSPAQADDVLSVQRNGSMQARPAGSLGSFEVGLRAGDVITWYPDAIDGPGGVAYSFACVELP